MKGGGGPQGYYVMESFNNKQTTTHLEVFQRLNDIFYQYTFAEIRKDSSNLKTTRYEGILGWTS